MPKPPFIITDPGTVPPSIEKEVTSSTFALMTGVKIIVPDDISFSYLYPLQVAGLNEMMDCEEECRGNCFAPYVNPVFGDVNTTPSYTNDISAFLLRDDLRPTHPGTDIDFILQKKSRNGWEDVVTMTNVLGLDYDFGSIADHPTYRGFQLNWGKVLFFSGSGCYRVKAERAIGVSVTERTDSFNLVFGGAIQVPGLAISVSNLQTIQVFFSTNPTAAQVEAALNAHPQSIAYGLTYAVAFSGGNRIDIDVTGNAQVYSTAITLYTGFIGAPFTNEGYILFEGQTRSIDWCFVSETFDLKAWNCNRAAGTVKFETVLTGEVGDKRVDYLVHDFDGFNWVDSIRLNGFFGLEKVPEYLEVNTEWGKPKMGLIQKVKDEMISEFTFSSNPLPKYIHSRFMSYGVMANELRVSDYNLNNSDYNIKRMLIVKAGAYDPTYYDKEFVRLSNVEVQFRKGVQSTIRSNC